METIYYRKNYNYKLFCEYHTTIRLLSKKYIVGNFYQIQFTLKSGKTYIRQMRLVSATPIMLENIPEYTWYTDTGINRAESINLMRDMYREHKIDVFKRWFVILVFKQEVEY